MNTKLMLCGLAVLALTAAAFAADDPFVGVWKVNVAKSIFAEGQEVRSQNVKIDTREDGYIIVTDLITATGKAEHITNKVKFDGKDYPLTGDPSFDSYSTRRVDVNTFDGFWKKGGKVTQSARWVISKDAKIITGILKTRDTKGNEITTQLVLDRQ